MHSFHNIVSRHAFHARTNFDALKFPITDKHAKLLEVDNWFYEMFFVVVILSQLIQFFE